MAPDIYLICGTKQRNLGISIVSQTRKAGFSVSFSIKEVGFGKQFKDAGKSGARYALIIGDEEAMQNIVKIKDMNSSGEISAEQSKLIFQLEQLDQEGGIPPKK